MQIRDRIVELRRVKARELVANPRNWRTHPKAQRQALEGVLREVGYADALLARETPEGLILIDGHLRAETTPDMEVPVLVLDLNEEEANLLLTTLDPLAAMAEAEKDALASLLQELEPADSSVQSLLSRLAREIGIELNRGEPPVDPGPQLDHAEELMQKWGTAPGQLWQIGPHRLMCGDSTCAEDVIRLMGGERAVLFATDPPYLVDYDGTNHPGKWNDTEATKKRKNKDWSDDYKDWDAAEQGAGLYDGFISVAIAHAITPDAAWYCWHASRNQAMVEEVWQKHGAFVHQQIIWMKDRPVLTRSWYLWQHEPCLFGWVKGHKPKRVAADYPPTVWVHPTVAPGTPTDHPTSKPVELFATPMRQHTEPGELCYEPFTGSGSQHVAAVQTRRVCYGMEKAPQFVAVALERLAGMGLEPVLGGEGKQGHREQSLAMQTR